MSTLPALSVVLQPVAPLTCSHPQQTGTEQHKDSLHLHDAPTPHGVPKKTPKKKSPHSNTQDKSGGEKTTLQLLRVQIHSAHRLKQLPGPGTFSSAAQRFSQPERHLSLSISLCLFLSVSLSLSLSLCLSLPQCSVNIPQWLISTVGGEKKSNFD